MTNDENGKEKQMEIRQDSPGKVHRLKGNIENKKIVGAAKKNLGVNS